MGIDSDGNRSGGNCEYTKKTKNKQIFTDRVRDDRVRNDRVRNDQIKSDRARYDQVKYDQVKYDRVRNDRGLQMIVNQRNTGQPRLRYKDDYKRDLKNFNISLKEWEEFSDDSSKWVVSQRLCISQRQKGRRKERKKLIFSFLCLRLFCIYCNLLLFVFVLVF